MANLADDNGAAADVLTLVEARCHLPRHMLLLLKLLLIRQHRICRTIRIIRIHRMYAGVRRLLPSLTTTSHLLHLHPTWIDWLLLHHLWQEWMLRLGALGVRAAVLLLRLHSAIVEGVHARIGSTVHAAVGRVQAF